MSHNIYKGKYAGVTPAWHRLGKPIPEGASATMAMVVAGQTNWDVKAIPLKITHTELDIDADFNTTITNHQIDNMGLHVIIRKDNDTGLYQVASDQLVFDDYVPISNEDVFGPMIELLTGEGLSVDAAGVLGRLGNRAFMTFNAGHLEVAGGEAYLRFMVALAAHTGRHAVRLVPTAIRVVCENTEQAALRGAKMMLSIEHNRVALDRFYSDPESGRKVLNLSWNWNKKLEQMATDLQAVPFDALKWETVIEDYMASKPEPDTARKQTNHDNVVRALREVWQLESKRAEANGQNMVSLWTAKQAVSTYAQHTSRGGTTQRAGRSMRIALGEPVPMMSVLNEIVAAVAMETNGALMPKSRTMGWLVNA
jgi:hypothetical protein